MKTHAMVDFTERLIDSNSNAVCAQKFCNENTLTAALALIDPRALPFDDFACEGRLYTEVGLASPFSRFDGTTWLDLLIGNISLRPRTHRGIKIDQVDVGRPIVDGVESKLGSGISNGIDNDKSFNQVTRTVCCIAWAAYPKPVFARFHLLVRRATEGQFSGYAKKEAIEANMKDHTT